MSDHLVVGYEGAVVVLMMVLPTPHTTVSRYLMGDDLTSSSYKM
jgi:hypothetical protein